LNDPIYETEIKDAQTVADCAQMLLKPCHYIRVKLVAAEVVHLTRNNADAAKP